VSIEGGNSAVSARESEDCLFLNIFAPKSGTPTPAIRGRQSTGSSTGKPIIVWYHGGGLFGGSISAGNRPSPDASNLVANHDVIVIAVQYRLGGFGFPGKVPGLGADEQNPGFRDQKVALQWVQANAAAFGGDPAKVTIMGQSGGGVSVDGLLSSSGGNQSALFRAAIMMSGGLHTFTSGIVTGVGSRLTGLGTGNKDEPLLVTLGKSMGCASADETLTCLRAKSVAELKTGISKAGLFFIPVDDNGKTVYADVDSARRAGKTAKVPVLTGNTFQEATMFSGKLQGTKVDEWARIIYPKNTTAQQAIVDAYAVGAGNGFKDTSAAVLQLHSEYQFSCITAYDGLTLSQNGIRK